MRSHTSPPSTVGPSRRYSASDWVGSPCTVIRVYSSWEDDGRLDTAPRHDLRLSPQRGIDNLAEAVLGVPKRPACRHNWQARLGHKGSCP
jgi:hypothetical protein